MGTGIVTIEGDTGVTLFGNEPFELEQYQRLTLYKRDDNEWVVFKDALTGGSGGGFAAFTITPKSIPDHESLAFGFIAHPDYLTSAVNGNPLVPDLLIGPALSSAAPPIYIAATTNNPPRLAFTGTQYLETDDETVMSFMTQEKADGSIGPTRLKIAFRIPYAATGRMVILQSNAADTGGKGVSLVYDWDSGNPYLQAMVDGSPMIFHDGTHGNYSPGSITFVELWWTSLGLYAKINGRTAYEYPGATYTNPFYSGDNSQPFRIGSNYDGSDPFTGEIFYCLVFNNTSTSYQSIAEDIWLTNKIESYPNGQMLRDFTDATYPSFPSAVLGPGNKPLIYYTNFQSHTEMDGRSTLAVRTNDGGKSFDPNHVVMLATQGPKDLGTAMMGRMCKVLGKYRAISGSDAVDPAHYVESTNGVDITKVVAISLFGSDATYGETNIVDNEAGELLAAFYKVDGVTDPYTTNIIGKSTDGGDNWIAGTALGTGAETALVRIPGTDTIITVANNNGAMVGKISTDGGTTFGSSVTIYGSGGGRPSLELVVVGEFFGLVLSWRGGPGRMPYHYYLPPNKLAALDISAVGWATGYSPNIFPYQAVGQQALDMGNGVIMLVDAQESNGDLLNIIASVGVSYIYEYELANTDTVPPLPASFTILNAAPGELRIAFNKTMDTSSTPDFSDFTSGLGKTFTGGAWSGQVYILTVSADYELGDVEQIICTPGANKFLSNSGIEADAFDSDDFGGVDNNITAPSSYLIEDNFNDTNGTLLSAHTIAPTNTPVTVWTERVAPVDGYLVIQGNVVSAVDDASSLVKYAWLDAGVSDYTLSVEVRRNSKASALGLIVGFDTNSSYLCGRLDSGGTACFLEKTSGSEFGFAVRGTDDPNAFPATDWVLMEITKSGGSYSMTIDGGTPVVYSGALTNTALETSTKVGIITIDAAGVGTRVEFRNFKVE